jgi:F0F1-type ATP synthase assembly protein I
MAMCLVAVAWLVTVLLASLQLWWWQQAESHFEGGRLVFILAGSLFYGTVSFRKKTRVLKYW